jgi:cytochrome c
MRLLFLLFSVILLGLNFAALAQAPRYNIGRIPSDEEMKQWTYSVGPAGKELPPGKGTARQGAVLYTQRCVFCHGPEGKNGRYVALTGTPLLPYATALWDYIYAAMPRSLTNVGIQEIQLTADEVYALTAYILFLNGLVGENDVLDAGSLPNIKIPILSESPRT